MNLVELMDNTKKLASWRGEGYGQNAQWTIKSAIPFAGTKTFLAQGQCFGESVKAIHIVAIQWSKITYFEEDALPENVDFLTLKYKDENYYLIRPTLESECTCRCSCADFEYRLAPWNFKNKALFGSPPKKYVKKTNRPPVNPGMYPGICKHIFQFQSLLHDKGYLA
jgi:hypothetical protein